MKLNAGNIGRAVIVLSLIATLATTVKSDSSSGKSGTDFADALVNSASGEVQVSMLHPLGWLIALIIKNPVIYPTANATGAVKILLPVILATLTPLWQMLIILNGIYFVWGARDPASRSAAKQRVIRLLTGMILCGLSAPIFQLILEVESTLAMQVLAAGGISTAEMVGGYIAGAAIIVIIVLVLVKLVAVSLGTALCPIIVLLCMPFLALGLRYIAVIIFALLFPVMIFLYFFDFTKKLGSKLFRTAMLWISVPIVQAILLVVMLEGVKAAEKVELMGAFVAIASFVMIGVAPFMMEGMMGAIGGAMIHSGYTTSNPRLIMIGSFVSGRGPASFTDFAWYANMGMQSPTIGGEFAERAMGEGMKGSTLVPAGAMRQEAMREEIKGRGGLDEQIRRKQSERNAVAAAGGSTNQLDREISKLKEDRRLAHVAPITKEQREQASQAKSYDELKGIFDREQMYRYMKEQEYARDKKLPFNGPDLSQHKGRIMRAYLTAPFAPSEILAPAGAFLGGLMTHIISDQLPLGKSLLGVTKDMMPKMEYKPGKGGKQVAVLKQKWETWGDVAKSAAKPALFVAGVSLLATLGMPVLLGAAGVGLATAGVKAAIGRADEIDSKITELDKTPGRLKEMRELAKKKMSGTATPDDEKRIKKTEAEFGGMKIEKVVQTHYTRKLAPKRELEELHAKAPAPGGTWADPEDQKRMKELRDAYGITAGTTDRDALDQIKDQHVTPHRESMKKQELEKLNTREGVERLLGTHGATELTPGTGGEKEEKGKLEDKERRGETLTKDEQERKKELTEKDQKWKDRVELGAIFAPSLDPSSPAANIAAAVAGGSPQLESRLKERREDKKLEHQQSQDAATPGTPMHQHLDETAKSFTASEKDKMERDQSAYSFYDPDKRQQLREGLDDLTKSGGALTPSLEAKYGEELDKLGISRTSTTAMDDFLKARYKRDLSALGISSTSADPIKELHDKVHGSLALDPNEDGRAYERYVELESKYRERRGEFTATDEVERKDLLVHLNMEGSDKKRELEGSIRGWTGRKEESQQANETLIYSEYATNTTKLSTLESDTAAHGGAITGDPRLMLRYGGDMDRLGIKLTDSEAMTKLQAAVNNSRQVQAAREIEAINTMIP